MNDKTKSIYYLCKLYDYAKQISDEVDHYNGDVNSLYDNVMIRHGVNMCLLQMGEYAVRIRDLNPQLYNSAKYDLHKIKGLRDRIAHSYGELDVSIMKNTIKDSIPNTMLIIETNIPEDLLENPYQLNEIEFDDYMGNHTADDVVREANSLLNHNDMRSSINNSISKDDEIDLEQQ